MCQSRVAASPDWMTTTGRAWAPTGAGTARMIGSSDRTQSSWRARNNGSPPVPAHRVHRWLVRGRSMGDLPFCGLSASSELVHGRARLAGLHVGIEGIPQRVPQEVDRHDGEEEGDAGEEGQPVTGVDELAALREHPAPRGDVE